MLGQRPEEGGLSEGLSIGRVAAKAGLRRDTLLRAGGAHGAGRPRAQRAPPLRRGRPGWITLLKCLRTTGMPISDMRRFVDLVGRGEPTVTRRREKLEDPRDRLEHRLREIE